MFQWLLRHLTSTGSALLRGYLLALRHPFLLGLRWLINLALAWFLIHPLTSVLANSLADSADSERYLEGYDFSLLFELFQTNSNLLSGSNIYLPFLLLLFVGLNFYTTGGIFSALWKDGLGMRGFFDACNDRLFPLIGVSLISLLIGAVLVPLPLFGMGWLVQIIADAHPSLSLSKSLWTLSACTIFLLLGSMAWRIFDYARLYVCAPAAWFGKKPGVFTSVWRACRFAVRNHLSTFLVLMVVLAIQVIVIWSYQQALPGLPINENLYWLEWGLGQVVILVRITTSLAGHAGFLCLLRELEPAADAPAQEEWSPAEDWEPTIDGGTPVTAEPEPPAETVPTPALDWDAQESNEVPATESTVEDSEAPDPEEPPRT